MRILVRVLQAIVGVLFIVSGLIKANDPLGLSYKMQEFFELWNSGLTAGHLFFKHALIGLIDLLHQHSLFLAVVMITLEVIAGLALLTGWKRNLVLNLLLVLIIFFTFLTGYAYLSGKFTNCGCFGDCVPITPLTSFTKDLLLLLAIVFLLAGSTHIRPPKQVRTTGLLLALSIFVTLAIQWYALNYLPPVDCLPFRKGSHIADQMKPAANAVQDSFAIKFVYEKNGKRFEFAPENLPADYTSYKFIDRKQELIRKGNADPAIKGFTLIGSSGEDSLPTVLQLPEVVLLFVQSGEDPSWVNRFRPVVQEAHRKQVPVYVVTSNAASVTADLQSADLRVPVFSCDFTVVRTAARTNPTLYLLKSGTVAEKFGARNIGHAVAAL